MNTVVSETRELARKAPRAVADAPHIPMALLRSAGAAKEGGTEGGTQGPAVTLRVLKRSTKNKLEAAEVGAPRSRPRSRPRATAALNRPSSPGE